MTFFDKKEEILEIKLTSYGKHLVGQGKFIPVYYKFFDDDILYDSEYANFSESSGDAETRIQEETPSLRLRTSFRDLEKEVRKLRPVTMTNQQMGDTMDFELILNDDELFLETYNAFSAARPLGNSDHGSQKLPAWNIRELKNGIDAITMYNILLPNGNVDLVSSPVINIPNIQSDITASMRIRTAEFCGPVEPNTQKYVHVYPDNTYFDIDDDFILLKVDELHVPLNNEAFEIEVFEVRVEDGEEVLIPKLFKKKVEYVRNGLLLDEEEINDQLRNNSLEVDSNYVEYWFDIRTDGQIDNKTRCEYILPIDSKGNIFDDTAGCEDYSQNPGMNLYPPDDFEPEDCE